MSTEIINHSTPDDGATPEHQIGVNAMGHEADSHQNLYAQSGQIVHGNQANIARDINIKDGDFVVGNKIININYGQLRTIPPPPKPTALPELAGFLGRQEDLEKCNALLKSQSIVILLGISGIGKTALAARLATRMNEAEKILWYKCYPDDSVQSVVWALAAFLASQDEKHVWETLHGIGPTGELPPIKVLLDSLFNSLAGKNYVLCFDDFQYLTGDAKRYARFVDKLRELSKRQDIQVIITSQQTIDFGSDIKKYDLGGLTWSDTQQLFDFHHHQIEQSRLKKLYALTEGNAQLLLFAIQALDEQNDIDNLIEELSKVTTVKDYLINQIHEGLHEPEQSIMRGMSVLLDWSGTADAIDEIVADQPNIQDTLDLLCARFLLHEIRKQTTEYDQHNTLQAYYYSRLTRRQRLQLHQRAATFYEQVDPDQYKAALHYYHCERYEDSANLAISDVRSQLHSGRATALRALLDGFTAEKVSKEIWARTYIAKGDTYSFLQEAELAQASFVEALKLLNDLPELPLRRIYQIEAYRGLGVLLRGRNATDALAWLQEGLRLAYDTNDISLQADLEIQIGVVQLRLANRDAAKEALELGLKHAPAGRNRIRLLALLNLGYYYYYQNQLVQSSEYMMQALEMAKQLKDIFNQLALNINLAAIKQTIGEWNESDRYGAEAERLGKELGNLVEESKAKLNAGVLMLHRGELEKAAQQLTATLEVTRQNMINEVTISCLSYLAELYLVCKDSTAAKTALAEAEQLATEYKFSYLLPFIYYLRAETYFVEQNYALAQAYAESAIERACRAGMEQEKGQALRILGKVQLATQQMSEAKKNFELSMSLLSQNPYEMSLIITSGATLLKSSHEL